MYIDCIFEGINLISKVEFEDNCSKPVKVTELAKKIIISFDANNIFIPNTKITDVGIRKNESTCLGCKIKPEFVKKLRNDVKCLINCLAVNWIEEKNITNIKFINDRFEKRRHNLYLGLCEIAKFYNHNNFKINHFSILTIEGKEAELTKFFNILKWEALKTHDVSHLHAFIICTKEIFMPKEIVSHIVNVAAIALISQYTQQFDEKPKQK